MIKSHHNIICISTVSYNHPSWTNKQQLMSRLAKKNRVFFVEDMVLPHSYIKQERFLFPIQKITSNLTIVRPIKYFPFSSRSELFNSLNYKYLARQLENLVPEPRLLWIYEPTAFPLLKNLSHDFSLYDCVDDYQNFPNSPNFFNLEEKLVKNVNLTITSSSDLFNKFSASSNNIYLVPNGADLFENNDLLSDQMKTDIQNIKGPKFLFAGAINFKLDMQLIKDHAIQNPQINFIFVGILERALPNLPNVYYFPPISNKSLGNLYELADMCYIPYQVILRGVNPLKVYEALSVGLPIYGRIIESLNPFRDQIFNCEKITPKEALTKANQEWRENLVKFHQANKLSWQDRLNKILQHIGDTTNGRIVLQ